MEPAWTPRDQGNCGELSAIEWLGHVSAALCKPLFENSDYDLVADLDGKLQRVQVETSGLRQEDRFLVALCARGGNGRRWYIPAPAIGGGSKLVLGGPKYSRYEIEPGSTLPRRSQAMDAAGVPLRR